MKEKMADFSIPIIEKKFDKFNLEYFGGKLKRPIFKLKLCKNALGMCSSKTKENPNKPTIMLSTYYKVKELEMENTLIHEMIHLYQYQILKERMGHKDSFKQMSARIELASQGKYIITRTNSRATHECSEDAKLREAKKALLHRNPTIFIFQQTNSQGKEVAWFMRASKSLEEKVRKYPTLIRYDFTLVGIITDKPSDWGYRTRVCRSRFTGGKSLPWEEFITKHKDDIMPYIVTE